jgi:hypothetical protein
MQKLREELAKPEYQGLSDQQAADAIMNKVVEVRRPVELWRVIAHASQRQYRAKLELASKDPANACQEMAINILSYITSSKLDTVDMDMPETRQMLQGLVACGFATEQVAGELDAMATQTVRWVDHEGIGEVGIGLIQNARK